MQNFYFRNLTKSINKKNCLYFYLPQNFHFLRIYIYVQLLSFRSEFVLFRMSLLTSVTDDEKQELSRRVKVVTVPDGICVTKKGYLPPTPALYIVKSGTGLVGEELQPTTVDLEHKTASEMNGRELIMRSILGEEMVSSQSYNLSLSIHLQSCCWVG